MPRPKTPPRFRRTRATVIVLLLVGTVVAGMLGAIGIAAITFLLALGLGTFGGGGPTSGGFHESGIGFLGGSSG